MKHLYKILVALFPLLSLAQQNYKSGDMTECHTWAPFADVYTTLKAISIKTGTTLNVNENVNVSSVTFNGNVTGLSLAGTNKLILSGDTTDVKCGTVYGTDMGDGKYKYTYKVSCYLTMNNYDYKPLEVTLGPLKKTATYKWATFKANLNNVLVSLAPGSFCWTTDWNLWAGYYVNGATAAQEAINAIIWNRREWIYRQDAACNNLYCEIYPHPYGFANANFSAGDMITIKITTPVTAGSGAINKTCANPPMLFIDLEVSLEEQ